ncbi:hypothetical protein [Pseudonocardia charpentierae]|uniref:Uncharacterized protein n=1 Tax=Pseudonocardia charpentierae TaxID=3075545 RepID=A0ABU2NL51_9PSEU|nr:hypothetical protein [Pseudonocardia sp. DSM 45834]MDT0353319.1 hypothetical protein [Pseudonocardia sp. DSM 45834]
MTILVTVSVNLAEPVSLHELRKFLETVEQNGADADMDLREYDENNDLVGLAAVGELSASESESNESDEGESAKVEETESADAQPDEESDC